MSTPIEIVEIEGLVAADRTPEQTATLDAYQTGIQTVVDALGDKSQRNAREFISNKLLLALLDGETPAAEDVAELKRVFLIIENAAIKEAILAG